MHFFPVQFATLKVIRELRKRIIILSTAILTVMSDEKIGKLTLIQEVIHKFNENTFIKYLKIL